MDAVEAAPMSESETARRHRLASTSLEIARLGGELSDYERAFKDVKAFLDRLLGDAYPDLGDALPVVFTVRNELARSTVAGTMKLEDAIARYSSEVASALKLAGFQVGGSSR